MYFQVNECLFGDKKIILSYKSRNIPDNSISVIVGKNAIGKSKLLASIVDEFLKRLNTAKFKNTTLMKPSKVIAISNTNNDRFPIKNKYRDSYEYFGNKSKQQNGNYDKFHIFKKILLKPDLNSKCLNSTFNYLNFHPKISIQYFSNLRIFPDYLKTENIIGLYYKYKSYFIETNILSKNTLSVLQEINPDHFSVKQDKLQNISRPEVFFLSLIRFIDKNDLNISISDFTYIFDLMMNFEEINKHSKYDNLIFDNSGYYFDSTFLNIKKLLELDLVKISRITFHNISDNLELQFNDLSSGQQSLFNIFLGISCCIDDNSLICIDEPEISLHPEWQSEFIIQLQELFREYNGCHFIIATHSPQIVSGLNIHTGFVVDLEKNITYSSSEYSKKSADFQLAHLFGAPGYNNEYILKLCFHLLSIIQNNNEISKPERNMIHELNLFKKCLRHDDPSLYLIDHVLAFFGNDNESV